MKSVIALITTVVLFAAAFPGIRAGLQHYSAPHLVLLRYGVASIVLLAIAFARRPRIPGRRELVRIVAVGIVGMTMYPLAITYGEVTVPAATASILVNLSPVFTAI